MILDTLKLKYQLEDMINIMDQMYEGFLLSALDGRIFYANQAVERISGISLDLIVGKTPKEMESDGLITEQSTVVKSNAPITMVHKLKNGKKVFITSRPIYNENGTIICFAANYRDLATLEELYKAHVGRDTSLTHKKNISRIEMENWIGVSSVNRHIKEKISKVAQTEAIVLILGESGVGKEVVANNVHKLSNRKDKPYIQINCGAIPGELIEAELFGYEKGAFTGAQQSKKGLLEAADSGTILLDEIGEMPLALQVKLLRVIQTQKIIRIGGTIERKLNLRFIAATNKDLKKEVKKGTFREDLYYRLNVIPVYIPSLRERKEDIIPIAHYFLDKYNKKYNLKKTLAPETLQMIQEYHWPGNVRQLENMVERLVIISENEMISPYDLPNEFNIIKPDEDEEIKPLKKVREEAEKRMIQLALYKYGTIRKAAKYLNVDHSTIVRKMKAYKMTV